MAGIMMGVGDSAELSKDQHVAIYEKGVVWITQAGATPQEIKLEAAAAIRLLDVLRQNEEDLTLEAKAALRMEHEGKGLSD